MIGRPEHTNHPLSSTYKNTSSDVSTETTTSIRLERTHTFILKLSKSSELVFFALVGCVYVVVSSLALDNLWLLTIPREQWPILGLLFAPAVYCVGAFAGCYFNDEELHVSIIGMLCFKWLLCHLCGPMPNLSDQLKNESTHHGFLRHLKLFMPKMVIMFEPSTGCCIMVRVIGVPSIFLFLSFAPKKYHQWIDLAVDFLIYFFECVAHCWLEFLYHAFTKGSVLNNYQWRFRYLNVLLFITSLLMVAAVTIINTTDVPYLLGSNARSSSIGMCYVSFHSIRVSSSSESYALSEDSRSNSERDRWREAK